MIWLATLVSHSFKKSAGPFHHASVPVADPLMFSQRGMYEGQPPLIAELDSCSMFAVVLVLYIYIYKMIRRLLLFKKGQQWCPGKDGQAELHVT